MEVKRRTALSALKSLLSRHLRLQPSCLSLFKCATELTDGDSLDNDEEITLAISLPIWARIAETTGKRRRNSSPVSIILDWESAPIKGFKMLIDDEKMRQTTVGDIKRKVGDICVISDSIFLLSRRSSFSHFSTPSSRTPFLASGKEIDSRSYLCDLSDSAGDVELVLSGKSIESRASLPHQPESTPEQEGNSVTTALKKALCISRAGSNRTRLRMSSAETAACSDKN